MENQDKWTIYHHKSCVFGARCSAVDECAAAIAFCNRAINVNELAVKIIIIIFRHEKSEK